MACMGIHTAPQYNTCLLITPRACARGKAIVYSLPRAHAQGVKQLSVVVVVVVVGTKIAVLGIYACCKHNQSVDIGAKLVCYRCHCCCRHENRQISHFRHLYEL